MRAALALVVSASAFTSVCASYSPAAAQAEPRGTYSDWTQTASPSEGFYNLDIAVYPANEPDVAHHGVYYVHQFALRQGSGGFVGLQTDRNGKRAIFAIWDALEAKGPGAGRPCSRLSPPCAGAFDQAEGLGYQAKVPYAWKPGHYYRYRVWTTSADQGGTWWGGWILDDTEKTETLIGLIRVPKAWRWLDGASITYIDYFDAKAKVCSELGHGVVYFAHPTGNAGESRAGEPSNHIGTGTCPSQITSTSGWVKHEMGLTEWPAPEPGGARE